MQIVQGRPSSVSKSGSPRGFGLVTKFRSPMWPLNGGRLTIKRGGDFFYGRLIINIDFKHAASRCKAKIPVKSEMWPKTILNNSDYSGNT